MMLNLIDGGVCAPQGFRAAGIHVGVKTHAAWKKDVALIVSDTDCTASAVFTKNVVKAAPIHVDKAHLADGHARAIIANSGNANACAPHGEENAAKMCQAAAAISCKPEDVLVSFTGVIGQTLNVQVIEDGVPALYAALEHSAVASDAAAHATTFGANPVCAAAGLLVQETLTDAFLAEVQAKGDYLRKAIESLNLPCFGKTRGMGLMIGIEVRDGYDKGKILSRLVENGLLVLTAGPGMRLLPPLTITKAELDQGLEIMKKALENF